MSRCALYGRVVRGPERGDHRVGACHAERAPQTEQSLARRRRTQPRVAGAQDDEPGRRQVEPRDLLGCQVAVRDARRLARDRDVGAREHDTREEAGPRRRPVPRRSRATVGALVESPEHGETLGLEVAVGGEVHDPVAGDLSLEPVLAGLHSGQQDTSSLLGRRIGVQVEDDLRLGDRARQALPVVAERPASGVLVAAAARRRAVGLPGRGERPTRVHPRVVDPADDEQLLGHLRATCRRGPQVRRPVEGDERVVLEEEAPLAVVDRRERHGAEDTVRGEEHRRRVPDVGGERGPHDLVQRGEPVASCDQRSASHRRATPARVLDGVLDRRDAAQAHDLRGGGLGVRHPGRHLVHAPAARVLAPVGGARGPRADDQVHEHGVVGERVANAFVAGRLHSVRARAGELPLAPRDHGLELREALTHVRVRPLRRVEQRRHLGHRRTQLVERVASTVGHVAEEPLAIREDRPADAPLPEQDRLVGVARRLRRAFAPSDLDGQVERGALLAQVAQALVLGERGERDVEHLLLVFACRRQLLAGLSVLTALEVPEGEVDERRGPEGAVDPRRLAPELGGLREDAARPLAFPRVHEGDAEVVQRRRRPRVPRAVRGAGPGEGLLERGARRIRTAGGRLEATECDPGRDVARVVVRQLLGPDVACGLEVRSRRVEVAALREECGQVHVGIGHRDVPLAEHGRPDVERLFEQRPGRLRIADLLPEQREVGEAVGGVGVLPSQVGLADGERALVEVARLGPAARAGAECAEVAEHVGELRRVVPGHGRRALERALEEGLRRGVVVELQRERRAVLEHLGRHRTVLVALVQGDHRVVPTLGLREATETVQHDGQQVFHAHHGEGVRIGCGPAQLHSAPEEALRRDEVAGLPAEPTQVAQTAAGQVRFGRCPLLVAGAQLLERLVGDVVATDAVRALDELAQRAHDLDGPLRVPQLPERGSEAGAVVPDRGRVLRPGCGEAHPEREERQEAVADHDSRASGVGRSRSITGSCPAVRWRA